MPDPCLALSLERHDRWLGIFTGCLCAYEIGCGLKDDVPCMMAEDKSVIVQAHQTVAIGVEWHPLETSKVATCGWDGLIKYWD